MEGAFSFPSYLLQLLLELYYGRTPKFLEPKMSTPQSFWLWAPAFKTHLCTGVFRDETAILPEPQVVA
jgi:hypothetical protein